MNMRAVYIAGGVLLLALLGVLMASHRQPLRRFDEHVTLRQRDKTPYGTAVARQLLPALFPQAGVTTDATYPATWQSIDVQRPNQAVILVAGYFDADEDELHRLERFVGAGNFVYIIARTFSAASARFFHLSFSSYFELFAGSSDDSLRLSLQQPPFSANSVFLYPGKRYEGSIRNLDSSKAVVLGRNDRGLPNFVRLNRGSGNFFLHTAPLAFSNYFILHRQNAVYYQNALSVIPKNVTAVVWNEYFLQKQGRGSDQKNGSWLRVLLAQPAFRAGFITALSTLLLYLLLAMRRRQAYIPPYQKPTNDSLHFVKTLGRLYYDKQDHKNLAGKLVSFFLEHVRVHYKIDTGALDETFVTALHEKSGYPEPALRVLVQEIVTQSTRSVMGENDLARLYQQLHLFYQNTPYGR